MFIFWLNYPIAIFINCAVFQIIINRNCNNSVIVIIFFSLVKAGIDVWFDDRNLQGADNYEKGIPTAIAESRMFIPILSAQCQKDLIDNASRYYKDTEWSTAQTICNTDEQYHVLPVRLPGYDPRSQTNRENLPKCMQVTIFDLEKSSVNELINRIKELLKQ